VTREPLRADHSAPSKLEPRLAVIDDLSAAYPLASNGARWRCFTDTVMGGLSQGFAARGTVAGRAAIRLQGEVSLKNNGGFIQIALDLMTQGNPCDASDFEGVELDVSGNGERYGVHLRTGQATRPWQSYRQSFRPDRMWRTVRLPFACFEGYRIDAPLDIRRLSRIGIVAIGYPFTADVAFARIALYK
jgi:hypothetical protein